MHKLRVYAGITAIIFAFTSWSNFSKTLALADTQTSPAAATQTTTIVNNASTSATSSSLQPIPESKQAPLLIPQSPAINAKGYILMDADSGMILAGDHIHDHLPPASLTKLMTVYVASQALKRHQINLDDLVTISTKAWQMEGSRMFVKVNSQVSIQDLIRGIIIASGNDACVAIAEHIAGSEDSFVNLMNQTAARLKMKDTHYMDATGMPNEDHYASPYDLALLTRAVIYHFPEHYTWYKEKWITYNNIRQPNRNRLLWRDSSVDGLKTGHTGEAGFCLIASAKRDNMRLIAIVMGAPSDSARADETEALLNWGFRFYKTYALFQDKQTLINARTWFGQQPQVALGVSKPLYVTIPVSQYKNLKATMQVAPNLKAPIIKGHPYGEVQIKLEDKLMATAPLVALDSNPLGGFFTRLKDRIILFIHRLL